MKKILLLVFSALFSFALMGCGGGGAESSSTEDSSETAQTQESAADAQGQESAEAEPAQDSSPTAKSEATTLQAYFDSNPEVREELLGGIEEGANSQAGLSTNVSIEGNDIIIVVDITQMYKDAGAADAATAKAALEGAGASAFETQKDMLVNAIKSIEDGTGVSGVHIIYRYTFDGEQVYEMTVDSTGNLSTSAA